MSDTRYLLPLLLTAYLPLSVALPDCFAPATSAQVELKYPLNFEGVEVDTTLTEGWGPWGTSAVAIDTIAYEGAASGRVSNTDPSSQFGCIAFAIPARYRGKTVRLEGYMKTKDVTDGFAGLVLRVDSEDGILAFESMEAQEIQGTNDWEKYSLEVDYPRGAKTIYVGGLMAGQGTAWFDNFTVTIDGEDIQTRAEEGPVAYPADQDTTFRDGSDLTAKDLNQASSEELALLGRVWGFVKYHHPAIARGEYNWDFELFRMLPDFLRARSQVQKESVMERWISALGPVPTCTDCAPVDTSVVLTAYRGWIDSLLVTEPLKEQLRHIYTNRNSDEHYYVSMAFGTGNPVFTHESSYAGQIHPDAGFRLLTLYRYWNTINYFFPYIDLTDRPWGEVLPDYIDSFIEADEELAFELATLRLIGEVHDTHANLWGGKDKIEAMRGSYMPAFHARFVEGQLAVTDYYDDDLQSATGLSVGDVITAIRGRPVTELIDELRRDFPASNEPTRLRDLALNLLRSTEDSLELTVRKGMDASETPVTIPLYLRNSLTAYHWYPPREKPFYERVSDDIGYITLQNITQGEVAQVMDEFRNTKGIVIDSRNYPSAFMPFVLAPYFITEPTAFVRFTNGSVTTPGQFVLTESLEIQPAETPYPGKVVVLVNELSQSQAEYTAMAFRAGDNVTIMGSTTAGADGNVSNIPLPGGMSTMISGIGILYPDGEATQRVGIVPDVVVEPTLEGLRAGRDELLEQAIELIERGG